jgi:hypothetical protein
MPKFSSSLSSLLYISFHFLLTTICRFNQHWSNSSHGPDVLWKFSKCLLTTGVYLARHCHDWRQCPLSGKCTSLGTTPCPQQMIAGELVPHLEGLHCAVEFFPNFQICLKFNGLAILLDLWSPMEGFAVPKYSIIVV